MRRRVRGVMGLAAAALMFAVPGRSAINPRRPGLPGETTSTAWTPTAAQGFDGSPSVTSLTTDNSWSSVMCVECHAANPARHTSKPGTAMPSGDTEPMYRGTHFVRHRLGGTGRVTTAAKAESVASGGWENLAFWPTTGGKSKYGNLSTYASPPAVGSFVAGEMICESCHNVLCNGGKNLLFGDYSEDVGTATLCTGCHPTLAGGVTGGHHPTGTVDNADSASVRHLPIDSGNGFLQTGGVQYYPPPAATANTVTCASCHRAHDAQTAAGARMLRRGASQVSAIFGVFNKPVNVVYYAGNPPTYKGQAANYVPGAIAVFSKLGNDAEFNAAGIVRKSDFAPETLLSNGDPLCDACHRYNDD